MESKIGEPNITEDKLEEKKSLNVVAPIKHRMVNFRLPSEEQKSMMEQRGGDEDGEFAMSVKQGDDDAYLFGMLDSQNLMARKKPQQQLMYSSMKRKTYSKYDLVKVKVYLEDHFYIFSRFLISRVLTLIKVYIYISHLHMQIKEKDSIRMTLDVKKSLVES